MPQIISDMALTVSAIYTLRGPRQVGKTTVSKFMSRRSLEGAQEEVLVFTVAGIPGRADRYR